MKSLLSTYKTYFINRAFVTSFFISVGMLIVAIFVNFYAGTYATEHASLPVTDIILSNIRTFDVDGIFVYSTLIFWGFFIVLCILNIRKVPYLLKSISLFTIIRSVFVSLTHIGPFTTQIAITPVTIVNKFSFGGDLFFSGHTGLPFLLALLFWNQRPLRIFFLFSSIFFATIVLLGHLHYSIDVLAAFFITYTINHLAEIFFKKDKERAMAASLTI